jgi:hypothetical protein
LALTIAAVYPIHDGSVFERVDTDDIALLLQHLSAAAV